MTEIYSEDRGQSTILRTEDNSDDRVQFREQRTILRTEDNSEDREQF